MLPTEAGTTLLQITSTEQLLNYGITDIEQNAIINQLFYWEIPAKIGKLTGELIIG
jgi:hypothetical protein